MASTLVIKVSCGGMLRRFTVKTNENRRLDINFDGLRTKIIHLFKIPYDPELIMLTYMDDDDDEVNLMDDDDLCEVMNQQLKFLGIYVYVNTQKLSDSSTVAEEEKEGLSLKAGRPEISVASSSSTVSPKVASPRFDLNLDPPVDYPNLSGMAFDGKSDDLPHPYYGESAAPHDSSSTATPTYHSSFRKDSGSWSNTFKEKGCERDYGGIDNATLHPHIGSSMHPYNEANEDRNSCPKRPQLDSCFVCAVNIPDGTVMAPSETFTKIWLMKNNGSLEWPRGTKIVWVGGFRLRNSASAKLHPTSFVPVNGQAYVSVNFTAPSKTGRYVSYWRLASPSGQKFGVRVWVVIQVEESQKCSICGSIFQMKLDSAESSAALDASQCSSALNRHFDLSQSIDDHSEPEGNGLWAKK